MDRNSDALELDLTRVFRVVCGKAWIILLSGLVAGALFFGYAKLAMTPMYEANALFCVNNPSSGTFSSSQMVAAQYLADTYMVILESRSVLNAVTEKTGLPYTNKALAEMVSSTAVNETGVFEVVVACPDPEHAAQIANAIVEILPEKITAALPGSAMYVVDEAEVNWQQVSPNYGRTLLLGALLGLVVSAAAVLTADMLDDSIRSEDYLQRVYSDVPLLAVVSDGEYSKCGYYTSFSQEKKAKSVGGKK